MRLACELQNSSILTSREWNTPAVAKTGAAAFCLATKGHKKCLFWKVFLPTWFLNQKVWIIFPLSIEATCEYIQIVTHDTTFKTIILVHGILRVQNCHDLEVNLDYVIQIYIRKQEHIKTSTTTTTTTTTQWNLVCTQNTLFSVHGMMIT